MKLKIYQIQSLKFNIENIKPPQIDPDTKLVPITKEIGIFTDSLLRKITIFLS